MARTVKSLENTLDSTGAASAAHRHIELVLVVGHGDGVKEGREQLRGETADLSPTTTMQGGKNNMIEAQSQEFLLVQDS